MNRSYAYRKHARYTKGMRRIKIDRMEHGSPVFSFAGNTRIACECFAPEADRGQGRIFDFFANTPKRERDPWKDWDTDYQRHQLRHAPRVSDWDDVV
jgi:hypothetical protein